MEYLGKFKLKITRVDSKWVPFDIEELEIIDSYCQNYPIEDDISLLATESIEVPDEIHALKVGESANFEADFWGCWHQDYWGEWDSDFEFRNIKINKICESVN